MYRIHVQIQVINEATGEVATILPDSAPVVMKSGFYPLFEKIKDARGVANALMLTVQQAMHLGSELYRTGVKQQDL